MEAAAFNGKHHQEVMKMSAVERWKRGFAALFVVAKDPNRTDKVLEAYEHMNAGGQQKRSARFYAFANTEVSGRRSHHRLQAHRLRRAGEAARRHPGQELRRLHEEAPLEPRAVRHRG
jgi:hypothetical protein